MMWRFDHAVGGYTMVDIMVGLGIFALLALASTNLFFSTTVGSTKDRTIREVKQNGEFALSQIQQSLRGAQNLVANAEGVICQQDMRSVSFNDLNDQKVDWLVQSNRITKNGSPITSELISVTNNRLVINCSYDSGSNSYYLTLSFTLSQGNINSGKKEEYYQETFESSVTLRNR